MPRGVASIFVYGTLLRGEPNHGAIAPARFVREAVTEPAFELADLGPYPALVPGGATPVRGEVYAVDAATLRALDALEEHPDVYVRTAIALADGARVQTYLLAQALAAGYPRIPSGDWRRR